MEQHMASVGLTAAPRTDEKDVDVLALGSRPGALGCGERVVARTEGGCGGEGAGVRGCHCMVGRVEVGAVQPVGQGRGWWRTRRCTAVTCSTSSAYATTAPASMRCLRGGPAQVRVLRAANTAAVCQRNVDRRPRRCVPQAPGPEAGRWLPHGMTVARSGNSCVRLLQQAYKTSFLGMGIMSGSDLRAFLHAFRWPRHSPTSQARDPAPARPRPVSPRCAAGHRAGAVRPLAHVCRRARRAAADFVPRREPARGVWRGDGRPGRIADRRRHHLGPRHRPGGRRSSP